MNDLLQEIWNDIQGYEGLYQVSNFGRVKSLPKKHDISMGKGYYITKERILQPGEDKDGYLQVGLRKNKKTKMRKTKKVNIPVLFFLRNLCLPPFPPHIFYFHGCHYQKQNNCT